MMTVDSIFPGPVSEHDTCVSPSVGAARPSKWSDLLQLKSTVFEFRGGYACCASHYRFSCC